MGFRTPSQSKGIVSIQRQLFWPALTTLAMLAITVSLGIWQIERLEWKRGVLDAVDRAEAAPPVALPALPLPFEKVEITGHFRDDLSAFYGSEVRSTVNGAALGAQLITPLDRADGPPILVDRGWVPDHAKLPQDLGQVAVIGYVRPAEPGGWITPGNDLATRRFFTLDPAVIGAAVGLKGVAPFTIVALGVSHAGDGAPEPASALPRPSNDHLSYAMTWFGLAICLVFVFAAYVRRTLRA